MPLQLCQLYVENLARVPKEAMDAAKVDIVIIGCGSYEPIKSYQGMVLLLIPDSVSADCM